MTDHTEATSPTRFFAPLAIIAGIPLIFAAIFFYTSPVILETGGDQGIFKCGSPSSPNTDAKNVCAEPERVGRNQAMYSGLSGLALLGLGAAWMVAGTRRTDEDDDVFDGDRPRRGSGDIDLRSEGPQGSRGRGVDADQRAARRDREPGRLRDEDSRDDVRREDRLAEERATDDAAEGRSSRREDSRETRRTRRDDDFDDVPSRRRDDDDWSSDGWR